MFRKFVSAALFFIILFESSPAFTVIGIDKVLIPSSEAVTIRPYKADMSELRDELELYRRFYLLFALFQGYVLIKAAAR
ncbi:MAG: hypothetical protein AABZ57_06140 [Candidatus Margulisiibacteriota bacterium]